MRFPLTLQLSLCVFIILFFIIFFFLFRRTGCSSELAFLGEGATTKGASLPACPGTPAPPLPPHARLPGARTRAAPGHTHTTTTTLPVLVGAKPRQQARIRQTNRQLACVTARARGRERERENEEIAASIAWRSLLLPLETPLSVPVPDPARVPILPACPTLTPIPAPAVVVSWFPLLPLLLVPFPFSSSRNSKTVCSSQFSTLFLPSSSLPA